MSLTSKSAFFENMVGDDVKTRKIFVVDGDRVSLDDVQALCEKMYPEDVIHVKLLVEDKINLNNLSSQNRRFMLELRQFNPDLDRIIVIGRSMSNFITGLVLGALGTSKVTLLVYYFDKDMYIEYDVDLAESV